MSAAPAAWAAPASGASTALPSRGGLAPAPPAPARRAVARCKGRCTCGGTCDDDLQRRLARVVSTRSLQRDVDRDALLGRTADDRAPVAGRVLVGPPLSHALRDAPMARFPPSTLFQPLPPAGPSTGLRAPPAPEPLVRPTMPAPEPLPRPVPVPLPGALATAVIAGLVLLLWPSETAPPWMDTLNPITGRPYASRDEYDAVRRMSPQAVTDAVKQRREQQPQPSPAPQATPGRRYPDQTCENDVLDALNKKIHEICDSGWSCADDAERDFIARQLGYAKGKRPTRRQFRDSLSRGEGFTPDDLARRLAIGEECLRLRRLKQTECFGGKPESGHDQQIRDVEEGMAECVQKLASRKRK